MSALIVIVGVSWVLLVVALISARSCLNGWQRALDGWRETLDGWGETIDLANELANPILTCCAAGHLPHDGRPGECTRALLLLNDRIDARNRAERAERTRDERGAA